MNLKKLIELSLNEDIGTGDITTEYLGIDNKKSVAFLICKQEGILAGLEIVMKTFKIIDDNINFVVYRKDGDRIRPKDEIMKITGLTKSILAAERVALNYLQRLSGIATSTRKMVDMISPYGVKLLDTRKTTPLLREYEKYAVRLGGGFNHRYGLYDMIMIKDNHIEAVGSIKKAVQLVKKRNVNYKVEVEVKNIKELREALTVGIDRILLDNMSVNIIKKAVNIVKKDSDANKRVELEISGGVNINNIEEYAKTGIDYISTGSITHSVKALDISLLIRE